MTDSEIIDALGGTTAVANLFGIEPASVSGWRKTGIPQARKQTLALMYPGTVPSDWRPGERELEANSAA
jgi:hypothetical protein